MMSNLKDKQSNLFRIVHLESPLVCGTCRSSAVHSVDLKIFTPPPASTQLQLKPCAVQ